MVLTFNTPPTPPTTAPPQPPNTTIQSPPTQPPTIASPAQSQPIASAWEEIEQIRKLSESSPDVALAQLIGMGGGGLRSRAVRGAAAEPESAEEYQKLLVAIKDLTRTIQDGGKEGGVDPASGALHFLRRNALMGTAGVIGSNAMSGDLIDTAASGVGGLIGLGLGGPVGAMAGATVGSMVGGGVSSFLGGAEEAREYSKLTADIAAQFGDFEQEEGLKMPAIAGMQTSGYMSQETAELFDQLRQTHVIDEVDTSSKQLVEAIQALTRATGMNTEAIVQEYSLYKNLGGKEDPTTYMSQMVAGAVGVGMRSHLQEYSELVGSARMQLVYGTGTGRAVSLSSGDIWKSQALVCEVQEIQAR